MRAKTIRCALKHLHASCMQNSVKCKHQLINELINAIGKLVNHLDHVTVADHTGIRWR